MKKSVIGILVVVLLTSMFSGCMVSGSSKPSTGAKSVSFDEIKQSQVRTMSAQEKESIVYAYVAQRVTIDLNRLVKASQADSLNINALISAVNENLKGATNASVPREFSNYMLMEFTETPYEWNHSTTNILGMDPSTRKFFVDVTYTTTGDRKQIVPKSSIPAGDENESVLKQRRYEDYVTYLETKLRGNIEKADEALMLFRNRWGEINEVLEEQSGDDLVTRTTRLENARGGIGKLTYNGIAERSTFTNPAEMVFRFILEYGMNLGEITDINITGVYLKNYELQNYGGIATVLRQDEITNRDIIEPFIDRLILSYNRAVEGCNDIGLCQLFDDYGSFDKYYRDVFEYTYSKFQSYSYEYLGNRNGLHYVLVDGTRRYRGKGTDMSLPTYNETYLYTCVPVGKDKLGLRNVERVYSELVGEPLSIIKDVSGVSEQMMFSEQSFSAENNAKVAKAIDSFAYLQINGVTSGTEFLSVVDTGISQSSMDLIIENIEEHRVDRKVTWVAGWETKSNAYVSVRLREVYLGTDSTEGEAIIDLANRDGVWRVVAYRRTLSVSISSDSEVSDKNAVSSRRRGEPITSELPEDALLTEGEDDLDA